MKKQASETDIDMAEMLDYQPENVVINNVVKSPVVRGKVKWKLVTNGKIGNM